jgi:hypothetical protein
MRVFAAMALSASMTAGCAAMRGAPEPVGDPEAEAQMLNALLTPDRIADCAAGLRRVGDQQVALNEEEAKTCRNVIIMARRYAMDIRFSAFEQSYFQANRWGGFAATLAGLGLGGAAAFSGETAARALAAAAGGVAGGRAAYEREIMADRALLTINAAMRSERDRIAVRLVTGMRLPVAEYPLPVALSDLEAYQRAGTVLGALTTLNQAAGEQAQVQQERLDRVSGFASAAASGFLQRLITAETTEQGRTAARARIREAMRRVNIDLPQGMTLTRFLADPTRAAQHVVIARELGFQPE